MSRKPRLLFLLSFLLVGLALAAQNPQPITYMAEYRVYPGQTGTFIELVKKYDKPVFDRLQAEGVVLAWGLDTRMIHEAGGATHLLWWVTANYAGQDKVFAALDAIAPTEADQARFQQATDPDKHHDHITRVIHMNIREEEPTGTVYTSWSWVKVKPGQASEWRELFEKYSQPVLDSLVADGTVFEYGIDVEDYHTEDPGWRGIWVLTTSLAAFDKIDAAFAAEREKRSAEERENIGWRFRSSTEVTEHRDSLWRSVSLKD